MLFYVKRSHVSTDREKVTRFREMYKTQMLTREGVSQVLYLGTTEGPRWEREVLKEWESGRSDLDIKVYGDGIIPGRVKIEGVLLIERLNYELDLRLEDVPLQHWTPIYVDYSPCPPPLPPVPRRYIDHLSEEEVGRKFTEGLRTHFKGFITERGWPLKHKHWWMLARTMKEAEKRGPPLSTVFL
jgi:hypothetical protein